MRRWLAPILIGLTLGVALLITLTRPATSPPGASALRLPTPVPPPTTTPEAPRGERPTLTFALAATEQVAIYSAAIHYLFTQPHFPPSRQPWPVVFVSPTLDGRATGPPTPPALLAALSDLAPRVEFDPPGGVLEGGRVREGGIAIGLGPINFKNNGEVNVILSSSLGPRASAGYAMRLMKRGERWEVVEATNTWVS